MRLHQSQKHAFEPTILAILTMSCFVLAGTAAAGQELEDVRTGPDEPSAYDTLFDQSDLGNVAQTANTHYHSGTRQLKRAEKLEAKAAETEPGEKRDKAEAKVQKAYEAAIDEFKEAIGYEPEMLEAYAGLGTALRRIGRSEEALQVHSAALGKSPQNLDNFEGWADSLLALNMLGDATTAYSTMLQSSPDQAAILMRAMKSWLAEKQADPGNLKPADVDRMADWIEQKEQETG
jgi:tetratricopeptide (TPR) repeat protein